MFKSKKVILLICITFLLSIIGYQLNATEKDDSWKSHILMIPITKSDVDKIASEQKLSNIEVVVNLAEFLLDNRKLVNDIKEGTIYNDGTIIIANTCEQFKLEIKQKDFYLHYIGGLGMPVIVGPAKIEHTAEHNWLIFGATYVGDYTCLYIDGYQDQNKDNK
jgi:hypothetical protein